jgi:hypothetical protein
MLPTTEMDVIVAESGQGRDYDAHENAALNCD